MVIVVNKWRDENEEMISVWSAVFLSGLSYK
jgi:hypothetical protein